MIKITISGKSKKENPLHKSNHFVNNPVAMPVGEPDKAMQFMPRAGMEECGCGCAGDMNLHVPEYGEAPTGNPDLNGDGVYSPEELYYHFDLDGDGIVLPDEYKAHVDWHAEHPEILGQMAGDEMYELDERACWKTHKKVGTKMKGGKRVNDCVPK